MCPAWSRAGCPWLLSSLDICCDQPVDCPTPSRQAGARNENASSSRFWGGVKGKGKKGREKEKNRREETKGNEKTRKGRKKKREGKKRKKGRKKKKGTPQNLAPRGIFVGTLAPKTALKCDFACCRTAVPQLRDCIPEVLSAVE